MRVIQRVKITVILTVSDESIIHGVCQIHLEAARVLW